MNLDCALATPCSVFLKVLPTISSWPTSYQSGCVLVLWFPFSRQILSVINQAKLLVEPEGCLFAESCMVVFFGNLSGNPSLSSKHHTVNGCRTMHQGLECSLVFHTIGSASIYIRDDFSESSTQIMAASRLSAQVWPSVALLNQIFSIFVAVLDFSHQHLYSNIFNNTVQCIVVSNRDCSHIFESDMSHVAEIASGCFSLYVGSLLILFSC